MTCLQLFMSAGFSLLIAGCGNVQSRNTSSLTLWLVEASGSELAECRRDFDSRHVIDQSKDTNGAAWVWLRSADGTGSHHCRKNAQEQISAWTHPAVNQQATHSLQYRSGDERAVFAVAQSDDTQGAYRFEERSAN